MYKHYARLITDLILYSIIYNNKKHLCITN